MADGIVNGPMLAAKPRGPTRPARSHKRDSCYYDQGDKNWREQKLAAFSRSLPPYPFSSPRLSFASREIRVHSTADIRMLNDILEHYGPIAWQRDNRFRIM
jgi:hypothetical protein